MNFQIVGMERYCGSGRFWQCSGDFLNFEGFGSFDNYEGFEDFLKHCVLLLAFLGYYGLNYWVFRFMPKLNFEGSPELARYLFYL